MVTDVEVQQDLRPIHSASLRLLSLLLGGWHPIRQAELGS